MSCTHASYLSGIFLSLGRTRNCEQAAKEARCVKVIMQFKRKQAHLTAEMVSVSG